MSPFRCLACFDAAVPTTEVGAVAFSECSKFKPTLFAAGKESCALVQPSAVKLSRGMEGDAADQYSAHMALETNAGGGCVLFTISKISCRSLGKSRMPRSCQAFLTAKGNVTPMDIVILGTRYVCGGSFKGDLSRIQRMEPRRVRSAACEPVHEHSRQPRIFNPRCPERDWTEPSMLTCASVISARRRPREEESRPGAHVASE